MKASDLLRQFGVTDAPVPVESIARGLGIEIQYLDHPDDSISGMLIRDGFDKTITVNASHSDNRQRFTIAHEIAHNELHDGDVFLDGAAGLRVNRRDGASSVGVFSEEIEANRFAAALLMPEDWIIAQVTKLVDESAPLPESRLVMLLAEHFHVSKAAMSNRLMSLGILQSN